MFSKGHILAFLIILTFSVSTGLFGFAGGDGSAGDPYQISNVTELQDMNNYLSAHYIMINDIDASITSTWNSGAGFDPIGTDAGSYFSGSLDGQNFTISALRVNRPGENYVGLFGYASGSISDVGMISCNIIGGDYTGGFAGYSNSNITGCYNTGSVTGADYTGGFIGYGGSAIECYSTVTVGTGLGNMYVGGFIGHSRLTNSQCYSTGTVIGNSADYVGGFVGYNESAQLACYSTGGVVGSDYWGGFSGYSESGANLENCYSTGNVYGGAGFIYENHAALYNCFWDTETSGTTTGILWGETIGATGKTTAEMKQQATFTNWDFADTWGNIETVTYPLHKWTIDLMFAGGDGSVGDPYQISNVSELQNMNYRLTADYIVINDINATETSTWNAGAGFSPVGNNSPRFTGNFDGQEFTIDSLYINRPGQSDIGLFGVTSGSSISNISFSNVNIAGGVYTGSLIGRSMISSSVYNCHTVDGIVIPEGNSGGLVGVISLNSTLDNCSNYNTSVSGADYYTIGGLVGWSIENSSISNSYAYALVFGYGKTGGLIGQCANTTVSDCYFMGDMDGYGSFVGGLIGDCQYSTVTNCFAKTRINDMGGTLGQHGGLIGSTLSSTYTSSFWDEQDSGISTSYGGTGKTTAEMKSIATYTDYTDGTDGLSDPVWDFISNPNDDIQNNNYWKIGSLNNGYPALSWQYSPDTPTNISISLSGDDVILNWDDMGVASYNIYRSTDPYTQDWGAPIGNSALNSYNDAGSAVGTKYFYYVKAVN